MTSPARTMYAMRAASPDPASLTGEIIPVPEPGTGEVLVEVRATAITAGELSWPDNWPVIPCHDLSGVVVASGGGVTGWQLGEVVYGLVGFDRPGAAAEYVTIPAADLAPRPAAAEHEAAAALPLGALTAWQALHEHAELQPGQHVLVHGGAGAVGAYAVQLAAAHGARVTATASARDRDFVTKLGAGQVIDYSGRFEDQVGDVDVVVDPVGGEVLARSWPVLRSGGILVAIADEPDSGQDRRGDVRAVYFIVRPDGGQLRELAALVDKHSCAPLYPSSSSCATYPRPSALNSTALARRAKWSSASTARRTHTKAAPPRRSASRSTHGVPAQNEALGLELIALCRTHVRDAHVTMRIADEANERVALMGVTDDRRGMTPTAVLGIGIMGSAMARNLLAAGVPTTVWDRSAAAMTPLAEAGAQVAASALEAVRDARVVITMLPTLGAVHEVIFDGGAAGRPAVRRCSRQ